MRTLPEEYLRRMKKMLGDEFPSLKEAYRSPAFRGIRFNPLKCTGETLKESLPYPLRDSPFSPLGFYLPGNAERIGSLPLHHAGAFYVQEPSASSAVTVLDPKPGERILDLCAAPGGKSTQIASLMTGKGVLWSNEVVRGRVNALLSNLERIGVRNAVVSCCHPARLCRALAGYFDRVLVDAPCSGEGMFRRSAEAVRDWSPAHVKACAVRQLLILGCAASAVRESGVLVYSTCTFSKEENEDVVSAFLAGHGDFRLEDCGVPFGRPGFLPQTRRIYPMDGGEGQFVARMRRVSPNPCSVRPGEKTEGKDAEMALALYREIFRKDPVGRIEQSRSDFFLAPENFPKTDGLGVLRAGVMLGTLRVGRVEPAHALFMAGNAEDFRNALSLAADSAEAAAFLRGEELNAAGQAGGYCAVLIDGMPVGFGKCSNGRIKNHYPKGLRNVL